MENHSKKQVIIFGQKAAEVLKNRYHFCKNLNVDIQNPTMQTFLDLAKAIEPLKQKKEIGRIHVIGSKFKNILTPKGNNACREFKITWGGNKTHTGLRGRKREKGNPTRIVTEFGESSRSLVTFIVPIGVR